MTSVAASGAAGGWLGPFSIFAGTYFLSALLRAVTATLAPSFSAEFGLGAADLGLLAGAYFLGFSMLQLPLGAALDRWGPRRVETSLLVLAVGGCALFAAASGFVQLVIARVLIGMGVAACLMAPLTFFRQHLTLAMQLRCNSWMLMTGSLGMLASTVPVQLMLPVWGWRGLFWALVVLLAAALLALRLGLPADVPNPATAPGGSAGAGGYGTIVRHPVFLRLAPMGMAIYGGLIAMQALWIGPWLTQVCGWTPVAASRGLLIVNLGMLFAFLAWGAVMPVLMRRGVAVASLLTWGVPVSLLLLALVVWRGGAADAWHWAGWCVATSLVALSQPAVGQAFPVKMAGRALSAYNLLIFSGVFVIQWGLGVLIDALTVQGLDAPQAYRVAVGAFGVLGAGSYVWFLLAPRWLDHNGPSRGTS